MALRAGERLAPASTERQAPARRVDPDRRRRARLVSPLTRRILTVNIVALGILFGGLLYLGQYEDGLIEAELDALTIQGEIFAGAIGQGAVATGPDGTQSLLSIISRQMLRRLVEPTRTRARLFAADGRLIADSRFLRGQGGAVEVEILPPPQPDGSLERVVVRFYETVIDLLPERLSLPPYHERAAQRAEDYEAVTTALSGEPSRSLQLASTGQKVLIATVPVQRFKKVLGALMLSTGSGEIEFTVREVRFGILKVFAIALAVTVLLSIYLAGTIARPVRRLAAAADLVRGGQGTSESIPDFTHRRDEIGDLSIALRGMTEALWQRLEAVESFAADVAHEIKNPLTSLQSAVETAARVSDPEQQRKLMSIIQEDVKRLDRLISDISGASRLDAELARAAMEPVDLGRLLSALAQVHESTSTNAQPHLELKSVSPDGIRVDGIEGRLVQVFQNLISNAFSFSPPGGVVRMTAARDNGVVEVTVDDDGPGIPEDNLDSIFDRFYTERPDGEAFGTHSGLGLCISRQIVEAHGGTIVASNRRTENGRVAGAHFEVRLPAS